MPRTALAPLILGDPDARLDGEDVGNQGRTCIVAPEPIDDGAWSELWNVVIPAGCSAPLSALPADERQRDSDRWKEQSASAGSATGCCPRARRSTIRIGWGVGASPAGRNCIWPPPVMVIPMFDGCITEYLDNAVLRYTSHSIEGQHSLWVAGRQ
jgi:hypothetical protein